MNFIALHAQKRILSLLRSTKIDTEKVCSFLHCRRNNSNAFLQWQIEHWRESARTNTYQPYDVLYYQGQLRIVCQYPVQLTDHLKEDPGSVELAYNWLKAEVEYFERKIFFDYAAEQNEQIKKTDQRREKMATVLSVADLACLFRIMVDSELLMAETPAEVMRLVSKTFRTMRVDDISEASLSNKYFTIERATFGKVKSHLVKLLNTLRELESGEKMLRVR